MIADEVEELYKSDKLTIFTTKTEVDPLNFREYIIKHWKDITKGLENSTILFLAGVHGSEDGKLGGVYEIRNIKNQVISNALSSYLLNINNV